MCIKLDHTLLCITTHTGALGACVDVTCDTSSCTPCSIKLSCAIYIYIYYVQGYRSRRLVQLPNHIKYFMPETVVGCLLSPTSPPCSHAGTVFITSAHLSEPCLPPGSVAPNRKWGDLNISWKGH